MTPEQIAMIAELARREAGLLFTPDQAYLIEGRIRPLLLAGTMQAEDLIAALRRGDETLKSRVIDALTNNETSFFRDRTPFALLRDRILPALAARPRDGVMRLWSAACSTGQEPYSMAMLIDGAAYSRRDLSFDILATDLSETCLTAAREGRYSTFEVQRGVPTGDRARYFEAEDKHWRLRPDLRAQVRWRRFNLVKDAYDLGRFDVVFCRNVLIYFEQETRRRVLEKIASSMALDGYLFLGASESVLGSGDLFAPVPDAPGVYQTARAAVSGAKRIA